MAKRPLTLHIHEDHNEVLESIYRALGSKRLAFSANIMIHFDSHPDLLIPSLPADKVFDKKEVQIATSIENWIVPLMYAGHVSTVVWIKKQWANQIEDGLYQFMVGRDRDSGHIRCSCSQPYFVSELLYCPEQQMDKCESVTLVVATYDSADSLDTLVSTLDTLTTTGDVILDIDLDYFSTTNPFNEMYSKEQLRLLSTLYRYVEGSTPEESTTSRRMQLDYLNATITSVTERRKQRGRNLKEASEDERLSMIESLVDEQLKVGEVNPDELHSHGCTFDTTGLPEHRSSMEEIDVYISDTIQLLSHLKVQPKLITCARSSDDDYCPKDQVDIIEEKVIKALEVMYKDLKVYRHYLEDRP